LSPAAHRSSSDNEPSDNGLSTKSHDFGDDTIPNFEGFWDRILTLYPKLSTSNTYLADIMAHKGVAQYQTLRNAKIRSIERGQPALEHGFKH
jgi:hypothetical protein